MDGSLVETVLNGLTVRAWRLHLETPGVRATVPMLRGVWGAALRAESEAVYRDLFEGDDLRVPRYLLRPAPREAAPAPAVEFVLFGRPSPTVDDAAWSAWERAARQGLGADRCPFRIARTVPLAWDGTPLAPARTQPGFALAPLPWPIESAAAGCRLEFPAPLRLIHRNRMVRQPSPPDLALAALRRLQGLVGPAADALWATRADWLDAARSLASRPWRGARLDLTRYSGSQRREVELQGVAGALDLPDGPGPLAPLLAAAQWLHLGKGTVMGLGQLQIVPIPDVPEDRAARSGLRPRSPGSAD